MKIINMIKISLVLCIGFVAMHGMEEKNNKKRKYEHNNELENIKKPKITIDYNELIKNAKEQLQNFIKNKSLLEVNDMSYEHHKEWLLSQSNIEKVAFLLLLMINDYNDMALKIVQNELVDINWQDGNGNTVAMLYLSIQKKPELEVFKSLLSNENIELKNQHSRTVLMIACIESNGNNNYDTIIKFLIDQGADINVQSCHLATQERVSIPYAYLQGNNNPNLEILKLLISDKNINIITNPASSLLDFVCYKQNDAIIEFLIEQGAEVSKKDNLYIPVVYLRGNKNPNIKIINLLKWNKDILLMELCRYNKGDNEYDEMIKFLIKARADIDLQNDYGCTAAMLYLKDNSKFNIEVFKLLISAKNINLQDAHGNTLLMLVANRADLNDRNEIIKYLIEHNADITVVSNDDKNTALMFYLATPNVENEIVALLIHDKTIDLMNEAGVRPIKIAYIFKHYDTINFLVRKKANINLPDKHGYTLLMDAFDDLNKASEDETQDTTQVDAIIGAIKKLFIYGADPDALDAEGNKATAYCSNQSILNLSQEISNYNNNVNNQVNEKALHTAVNNPSYLNAIEWLILAIIKQHNKQIKYYIKPIKCDIKYSQEDKQIEYYSKDNSDHKTHFNIAKYYLDNIQGYTVKTVLNKLKQVNNHYAATCILQGCYFLRKSIPEEYSFLLQYSTEKSRKVLLDRAKERNDKKFGKKIIEVDTAIQCLQAKGYPSELALQIASYL